MFSDETRLGTVMEGDQFVRIKPSGPFHEDRATRSAKHPRAVLYNERKTGASLFRRWDNGCKLQANYSKSVTVELRWSRKCMTIFDLKHEEML